MSNFSNLRVRKYPPSVFKPCFRVICVVAAIFMAPIPSFGLEDSSSVVKVFVTSNTIDYYRPWQSRGMETISGSGAIIDGQKILTNAHVVSDATFIQLKKNGDPKKYIAEVEVIGQDCDLAILNVIDKGFFNNTKPLEFGGLPKVQDTVTVMGYPQGGDKIAITEGVVSRIEMTPYAQSGRRLLAVQIDAAINSGNSGGPVIQNNKIVGIAMQVLQAGQNIGYMIPTPIIEHFLSDLKDGAYGGFPLLGIEYNNTENQNLRKYYHIDTRDGGVVVNRVLPFSAASEILHENDIILEIDGIQIGEDGTFLFRDEERLDFPHLITDAQVGDKIELKIIRGGKEKKIKLALLPFKPIVPYSHYYEKPSYYIFGGLIFTVLSSDLLRSWGNRWWENAPLDFSYYLIGNGKLNLMRKNDIVVLLGVIPDDINVGYHMFGNDIIEQVNGQEFDSFKAFVNLVSKIKDNEEYTVFQTMDQSEIVIQNTGIETIDQKIAERNNISSLYSKDVKTWLEQKKDN